MVFELVRLTTNVMLAVAVHDEQDEMVDDVLVDDDCNEMNDDEMSCANDDDADDD